jgi:hypothetical protein
MFVEDYRVKRVSFDDYDKYFKDLLGSPDDNHIVFYRRGAAKFTITFSYDQFIIITEITIERIQDLYAEQLDQPSSGVPLEVATDTTGDDPAVRKFLADYLPRGIPEVD